MPMSIEPMIAGTSATRPPRQISSATLRLQKQLDQTDFVWVVGPGSDRGNGSTDRYS